MAEIILLSIFAISITAIFFGKGKGMTLPLLIIVTIVILIPLCWAVVMSFFNYGIYDPSPIFVGLDNFKTVFKDEGLKLSLNLTALWAFIKTTLEITIAYFLALYLRNSGRFTRIILLIMGIGWFLPSFISVAAWRGLVQGYGGYSLLASIIGTPLDITVQPVAAFIVTLLVNVWLSVPLSTLIIIGMLQSISRDLDDMMALDGLKETAVSSILFGQIRFILIPYYFFQLARSLKGFSTVFLLSGKGPLVPGGFTPQTIVGSTSFLGVILYDKFQFEENYGLLGAYSAYVGVLTLFWLAIALLSRLKIPKRHKAVLGTVLIAHTFSGFYSGWNLEKIIVIAIYTLALFIIRTNKKLFRISAGIGICLDLIFCIIGVLNTGISGLNPATLLSVPALLLSLRYKLPVINLRVYKPFKIAFTLFWSSLTVIILTYIAFLSLSGRNTLLPSIKNLTLINYVKVFLDDKLWLNIWNTLKIALLSVGTVLFTAVPFSYIHVKKPGKFSNSLLAILLFGSMYTGMHTLLPLYMFFQRLSLLNSFIGIALIIATQAFPITIVTLISFFSKIPEEYWEFATLEGITHGQYFRKVVVPISLPVFTGVITYTLVSAWNSFTVPLLFLDSNKLMPFSLKIFSYAGEIGSYYTRWNLFGAAAILGIIPLLLFFRGSQRMLYSDNLRERGINYE